ncbi:MAG: hypothetical protein K2N99_00860, partial [Malacoplasma sp.]|nr:hypothetical protein [Malacoplasma sp.]
MGLVNWKNSQKNISLIDKSFSVNESTADSNINLEDALPVADSSITSFGDYIVSYEDNNISPVNITIPSLTTNQAGVKDGGATVGMTTNKQTITLTTYAGLLLWSHKLTENKLLQNYYSTVKSVSDISTYKVINFVYLESKNILFVLFGNETIENNVITLSNLVVFGLDINSGAIVVPKTGKLADNQVITSAKNNSAFIFLNSSDQLIVTSAKKTTDLVASTKIISFDENGLGFANVKGNDQTNFTFTYDIRVDTNDLLIGIAPSSVKGINFTIWLSVSTNRDTRTKPSLSYKTSNNATSYSDKQIDSNVSSWNYYVVLVNDELTALDRTVNRYRIINKVGTPSYRGYLNSENKVPDFEKITKRFFITSNTTTGSNTNENLGVLLDSSDKMFSSFATMLITTNNNTPSFGTTKVYMNYIDNQITGPTNLNPQTDSKTGKNIGLENNLVVNNWNFNSVGYDKESNFVYFSLSGEVYNYTQGSLGEAVPDKYLTNTRYIDLKDGVADANRVSSDAYVQDIPYTLSDVNFETYTDTKNLYLAKQAINGNDGQWLATTVTEFNDDTKDFLPTTDSKIDFSSLKTFESDIENSQILNEVMPSVMNDNLNSLDKFLNDKGIADIVKFRKAIGDDTTGEIRLETEITYPNDFGDGITNGKVSYVSYIQVIGFKKNDFLLTFKENTNAAVLDIKAKYSAEKIVQDNNVAFVINNLLQNITIKGQKFILQPNTVTLKNAPSTNDLTVEIKVPIKTSITDEQGILPIGFPENDAIFTITYDGFTGTEAPPLEIYPNDSSNTSQQNNLSEGMIVGIIAGCLLLAAVIITIFM